MSLIFIFVLGEEEDLTSKLMITMHQKGKCLFIGAISGKI